MAKKIKRCAKKSAGRSTAAKRGKMSAKQKKRIAAVIAGILAAGTIFYFGGVVGSGSWFVSDWGNKAVSAPSTETEEPGASDNTEPGGGDNTDIEPGENGGAVTVSSIFGNNPTYSGGAGMFFESVDESGNVIVKPACIVYSERDATFNIEASTLYYAEATFTYNVTKEWPVFGLAHFKALNTTIADGDAYNNAGALFGRRCIESVMSNSGKFFIKDLKPTDDHWFENYASDNIYLDESFKDNATFTTMTIAIARTADKMYTFVDGVLIWEYDVPADYSGATTPGIISCGAANDFTASNITVLSGIEAQTKLDEVIQE